MAEEQQTEYILVETDEEIPSEETEEHTESKPEEMDMLVFHLPGEVMKVEVKKIVKGKIGDFINIGAIQNEEIRKRLLAVANEPAIKIVFEIPGLGAEGEDVIRLCYHENCRYIQLGRCYDHIKVGDTIYVELTNKGRFRIVCPPRQR